MTMRMTAMTMSKRNAITVMRTVTKLLQHVSATRVNRPLVHTAINKDRVNPIANITAKNVATINAMDADVCMTKKS